MSTGGLVAFLLLAVNPIGGLLAAIPFAILKLDYPAWFTVVVGVPCCYVQVVVVDRGWTQLERWHWFRHTVETRRGKWATRLLESRGAFWVTYAATPLLGPWLVMALMRFAGVPHRHVAAAMALSLVTTSSLIAALCVCVPQWFKAS